MAAETTGHSSSDGEEAHMVLPRHAAAPPELRGAHRHAAVALCVSALLCAASVSFMAREQQGELPVAAKTNVGAEISLSDSPKDLFNDLADGLKSTLSVAKGFQYGMGTTPFHLLFPSTLRSEPSPSGHIEQQIPAGCQVFPLQQEGGWVQVVVPDMKVGDVEVKPGFGWLPEKEGGLILLEEDTELKFERKKQFTGPQATQENVDAAWDEVRGKSALLKAELAKLHSSLMEEHANLAMRSATDEANGDDVTKAFKGLTARLQKEFNAPTPQLHELGSGLAE